MRKENEESEKKRESSNISKVNAKKKECLSTRTEKNLHVSATRCYEGGTSNLSTPWIILIIARAQVSRFLLYVFAQSLRLNVWVRVSVCDDIFFQSKEFSLLLAFFHLLFRSIYRISTLLYNRAKKRNEKNNNNKRIHTSSGNSSCSATHNSIHATIGKLLATTSVRPEIFPVYSARIYRIFLPRITLLQYHIERNIFLFYDFLCNHRYRHHSQRQRRRRRLRRCYVFNKANRCYAANGMHACTGQVLDRDGKSLKTIADHSQFTLMSQQHHHNAHKIQCELVHILLAIFFTHTLARSLHFYIFCKISLERIHVFSLFFSLSSSSFLSVRTLHTIIMPIADWKS